ncbi:HYR-like domain-containing protein, partial [Winogradskyella sp.]|uniref:HYR-like domain-containing protein n=1 Tax=Winogradskyella sp. TaxID=1883156 RepID=UPI003F69D8A7
MRNTYHRVHRYKFIQIVLTIVFYWFVQTFNAQGKINPTTYKNSEAPVFDSEAYDLTVQCNSSINTDQLNDWLSTNGSASAIDNCGQITWTNNFNGLTYTCGNSGYADVTFTASDQCGNSINTTARFTIEDTVGPTINGFPSTPNFNPDCINIPILRFTSFSEISGDGDNSTYLEGEIFKFPQVSEEIDAILTIEEIVNASIPVLDDNSIGPNSFKPQTAFSLSNVGDRAYVQYKIDFVETNTNTPVIIPEFYSNFNDIDGLPNYTEVNWAPLDSDYTFNNPTSLSFTDEDPWVVATGGIVDIPNSPSTNALANFSSRNLNTSSISFRVGVVALTSNPSGNPRWHSIDFACVSNYENSTTITDEITIECSDLEDAETLTSTDDCSNSSVEFTETRIDGSCDYQYTLKREWTATDECGNETKRILNLNVIDTTAPTFTVPADITVECDVDVNDLSITGDVTDEADNCSAGLDAVYADTVASGSCDNQSVITRTWSLTDACDNTTSFVQTITVVDTTAPTFTVPADITVECDVDVNDLS